MLTQKQELFTQNIFKGMSQREAYIEAGYSSNQLPATLDNNAYMLMQYREIKERLAELNETAVDDSIGTVKERRRKLTDIYRRDEINPKHRIHAIDTHNKMDRLYEPESKQVFNDIKIMVVYDKPPELPEPPPDPPELPASQETPLTPEETEPSFT